MDYTCRRAGNREEHKYSSLVLWAFFLYLEAVAILPQLVLLQRTKNIDNLTGQYVFLLGAYRASYIVNWIYRYFTETHFVYSWISEFVQMLLYADFFYYYFQGWKNNQKLPLPKSRKNIYKGEVTLT